MVKDPTVDEELIYKRLQQQRSASYRDPFISREDRDEYNRNLQEAEDSTKLTTAAKIAGLGFGAYLLGRAIPKDLYIDALNKMGSYGSSFFNRAISARNAAVQSLGNRGGQLVRSVTDENIGLVNFIEKEARPLFDALDHSITHRSARQRALDETKSLLEKRYSLLNRSHNKYVGLTVADVLSQAKNNQNSFSTLSTNALSSLVSFRNRVNPTGSWFDNLVIDPHIFRERLRPNSIADIRWSSKKSMGSFLTDKLGFEIPYTGFRPLDLFTPIVRLFSKGEGISRVGNFQTVAQGIKTPAHGLNYIIDGKLFNFNYRTATRIGGDRLFRSHPIDSIAKANLSKLGNHPLQRLQPNPNSFWQNIQAAIGFGPMYREEPAALTKAAYNARVSRGLRSGDVSWKSRANLRAMDLPPLMRSKVEASLGKTLDPHDLIANPYSDYRALPLVEKIKSRLGGSVYGDFIDRAGKSISDEPMFRSRRPSPMDYGYVNSRSGRIPINHTIMEDSVLNKVNVLGHFLGTRLNQLIGATAGIGFRPSQGKYGALLNAVKIAGIGFMFNPMNGLVVDAAKYVNFLFERMTSGFGHFGDGVGLDDIAIKGYEGATLAAAGVKDITGITSGAKYLEGLFPGIVNSPLSGFARTLAPALIGSRFGPRGLVAGLLFAGATGGISDVFGTNLAGAGLATSASDLFNLYSGDKKERIRSSRWWMLGRQNYYGEGTDRFEQNWVSLFKSDYEYSNSLFGSKAEYFSNQSNLPTFHNMFLMGGDEDYFAEKHKLDRPYPERPSGENYGIMGPQQLAVGPGLNRLMGAGFLPPEQNTYPIGSQNSIDYKSRKMFDDVTEMFGIYKFLGETMFGKQELGPTLANAGSITDVNRLYWDKDLGGLLGHTELLRRYITAPNSLNVSEYVNTIPNTMPSFLPGQRSMFDEDRSYYRDFTVGDPYTVVKGGEYRLPGAGYEAVNELHSGKKGEYDPVDAFLILSDVAPYSRAHKHFSKIVRTMNLSDEWQEKVDAAREQRDIQVQGFAFDFSKRRSESQNAVDDINNQIKRNSVEQFLMNQYDSLTLDVLPEVGRVVPFGSVVTHKLFPHHTAEQDYLERVVYQGRFSNWSDPYEGFVRPKMLTLFNENPLTAGLGGAAFGLLSSNPTTRLALSAAGTIGMSTASAGRAAYYGSLEGGYIPEYRDQEQEVVKYFDKLEYLRYENSINRAKELGNLGDSAYLKYLQSSKTMAGLNYNDPNSLRNAKGALPKQEKMYFEAFRDAPESVREDILRMTPDYMQDIYKNIWDPGSVSRNVNAEMASFIENNDIPEANWAGWNLGIEKWQIMSRTMDTADNSVAIDMHRQYVSTNMMRQAKMMYPDIGVYINDGINNEIEDWHAQTNDKIELRKNLYRSGYRDAKVTSTVSGGPGSYNRTTYKLKKNKNQYEDREYR